MGRWQASRGARPGQVRKAERAQRARQTVNKDIPALLQAYPQARQGLDSVELIRNPPPVEQERPSADPVDANSNVDFPVSVSKPVQVSIRVADTMQAARDLLKSNQADYAKPNKVAVLNMASELRAGGGFLNGAQAQEEALCMRSTLFPSLRDEFYRLPEVGGIWTPDVLVFRSHGEGIPDLPKADRFFVDVISAAMIRRPDVDQNDDGTKTYSSEKDRVLVDQKVRAVMRIARSKGVAKLVLGAWGCGAFRNPVPEVARIFRNVLLGDAKVESKSTGKASASQSESWDGMEIVFAINQPPMAQDFAEHFGIPLELDQGSADPNIDDPDMDTGESSVNHELQDKITELESQIAATRSEVMRDRLQSIVGKLKDDGRE